MHCATATLVICTYYFISQCDVVTRLWAGRPGFVSRPRRNFHFDSPLSVPAPQHTHNTGLERQDLQADHLFSTSVEVRNAWSYTSTPPYVSMVCCFVKAGGYLALSWNVNQSLCSLLRDGNFNDSAVNYIAYEGFHNVTNGFSLYLDSSALSVNRTYLEACLFCTLFTSFIELLYTLTLFSFSESKYSKYWWWRENFGLSWYPIYHFTVHLLVSLLSSPA